MRPAPARRRSSSTGSNGYCGAIYDPVYFYPDGTLGTCGWVEDPSSPNGWSLKPDPCIGLTDWDATPWYDYQSAEAYGRPKPELTNDQIDQYAACWGWWF